MALTMEKEALDEHLTSVEHVMDKIFNERLGFVNKFAVMGSLELEVAIAHFSTIEDQVEHLVNQKKWIQEKSDDLEEQLRKSRQEYHDHRIASIQLEGTLRDQLDKVKQKNKDLSARNHVLEGGASQIIGERDSSKEALFQSEKRQEAMEKCMEELKLSSLQNEEKALLLTEENEMLRKRCKDLEQMLASNLMERNELKGEVSAAKKQMIEMETKMAHLNKDVEHYSGLYKAKCSDFNDVSALYSAEKENWEIAEQRYQLSIRELQKHVNDVNKDFVFTTETVEDLIREQEQVIDNCAAAMKQMMKTKSAELEKVATGVHESTARYNLSIKAQLEKRSRELLDPLKSKEENEEEQEQDFKIEGGQQGETKKEGKELSEAEENEIKEGTVVRFEKKLEDDDKDGAEKENLEKEATEKEKEDGSDDTKENLSLEDDNDADDSTEVGAWMEEGIGVEGSLSME